VNLSTLLKVFDTVSSLWEPRKTDPEVWSSEKDKGVSQSGPSGFAEQLELRLTNVVVAALKEAFDRDHQRLELERAHLEEQRRRADEAIRRELQRQSIDREIGRLRFLAVTALAGWIASVIVLVMRLGAISIASRTMLGIGSLLMLASLAVAFMTETRISNSVAEDLQSPPTGGSGNLPLWLLVAGLALLAVSLLL